MCKGEGNEPTVQIGRDVAIEGGRLDLSATAGCNAGRGPEGWKGWDGRYGKLELGSCSRDWVTRSRSRNGQRARVSSAWLRQSAIIATALPV